MATEPMELNIAIDRTELDRVIADLELGIGLKEELERDTIAELRGQLESTEKAYDRSLQENIKLHEELSLLKKQPKRVMISDPKVAAQWLEGREHARAERQAEALKEIPKLVAKVEQAVGQRANMKDTLVRTQNACRRYKARLKRQKLQLEALQELANAAFPIYEKMSGALDNNNAVVLTQETHDQCMEFHEKFNKAAEALTPPTIYKADGLEIKYS